MNNNLHMTDLTLQEASEYVRLEKRTLDNMHWMGTKPIFRIHGGRIFHHIEEHKEWFLKNRNTSTRQY